MKNRKILAVLLSLSVVASLAACANKPTHSDVTAATVSKSTTMTEATSVDETDVTESSEEAGAIVKEAKVPEGDIVRVNMDGMTVDAVIANLSNLTKHFDRNNPASYGDIFEVKSPCVYGEVLPKTNMKTADILLDNVAYEIKSPKSANSNTLEHVLKKALKQSSNIIIDTSRMKNVRDDNTRRFLINQVRIRKQIKKLIMISKQGQIIDISSLV